MTRQAMIFAAGLGTRLKPLTDTMPKALVKVGGQPLLWHVVQKLKTAGYERVVVNVHHFAEQIVDYLKENQNFGLDIRISDESDGLLETGGGIKKALPLFDSESPILIHNVDILSNLDLNALPTETPLLVVSQRPTKRYLQFDGAERNEPDIVDTDKTRLCVLRAFDGIQKHRRVGLKFRLEYPLPRVNEIAQDVDANPHAYYFQQAKNGLYVREALICNALNLLK